jgi:hypothetical protein
VSCVREKSNAVLWVNGGYHLGLMKFSQNLAMMFVVVTRAGTNAGPKGGTRISRREMRVFDIKANKAFRDKQTAEPTLK